MSKVDYVRSEARKGAGDHHCHWPGCGKAVPPAMWGCKQHWLKLPLHLRNKIWASYRPGQEIEKRISGSYYDAATEVQSWIRTQYALENPMRYDL
jgi:hypothetical protein